MSRGWHGRVDGAPDGAAVAGAVFFGDVHDVRGTAADRRWASLKKMDTQLGGFVFV